NDNLIQHILTQDLDFADTLWAAADSVILGDTLYIFINPNTGDTIDIKSLDYMINVPLDTIKVQDRVQSWYVVANTGNATCGGVWLTRDALRFGANTFWWHFNINYGGGGARPMCAEFTSDGDVLYIGTSTGAVYRISGLSALYGNDLDTGYATG